MKLQVTQTVEGGAVPLRMGTEIDTEAEQWKGHEDFIAHMKDLGVLIEVQSLEGDAAPIDATAAEVKAPPVSITEKQPPKK